MLAVRRVSDGGEKGCRARLRVGYREAERGGSRVLVVDGEDGAARARPPGFPQEVCKRHARVTPDPS